MHKSSRRLGHICLLYSQTRGWADDEGRTRSMAVLAIWVLLFLVLGALVGISMYTIICLQDLQGDLINPHDCSSRVNQLAIPEFALQAVTAALLLGAGSWSLLLVHVPLAVWHSQLYANREHVIEVTDMFGRLESERTRRAAKMAAYALTFVVVVYRGTESAVNSFLTPEGKAKAADFFREAVITNMHHF